jgi:oxygen-independent coproporphyrinogen-3 oxidase
VTQPLALYLHIPFCAKHCAYCDFNTYTEKAQSGLVVETVEAICTDIAQTAEGLPLEQRLRPVESVFFGGGTPTFLSGEQLTRLLNTVRERFAVSTDAEITSEANPSSSDAEKFAQMRSAGFNRLSIGVQAFDDTLLKALDRFHTAGEAQAAFLQARAAAFDNISLDLMFGLPKQTRILWEATLERALGLEPEHISLYALTLEPGTRFERLYAGGKLELPDEDDEIGMYERSMERLTAAGYEHYEVSNFARVGRRSRHNQTYWRNEDYLGFGPGAVSYLEGRRWKRERLPKRYVEKVRQGADLSVESERLERDGTLGETFMLGLRMREGMPLSRIRERFGVEPHLHFGEVFADLKAKGWLEETGDTVRLTHTGLLLANEALQSFLAAQT